MIAVTLENTSDEAFSSYPGLHVSWWVANTYQPVRDGDLLLYALGPHERWEHRIAATELPPYGRELVVHAEPLALGTGHDGGCRSGDALVFSAPIPSP